MTAIFVFLHLIQISVLKFLFSRLLLGFFFFLNKDHNILCEADINHKQNIYS